MNNFWVLIFSIITFLSSPFTTLWPPSPKNSPNITPTIAISPTPPLSPSINQGTVITGTVGGSVTSAVVNMQELAKKQQEVDEYKKTDHCHIEFVKSNYKSCPPGCFYQQAPPPPQPGSEAPMMRPRCAGKEEYLKFY